MSRWRWLVGAAFVTVVGLTTWSQPQEAITTSAAAGTGGGVGGPRLAAPWQPGTPQLGVHVYWEDNPLDDDAAVRRKAARLVDQIVGMEANSVAVSFPFFTDALDASNVYVDARTPAPVRLALLLRETERAGLRTTVRPLLDQRNLQGAGAIAWRGQLDPADRSRWFSTYTAMLTPYLQVAQAEGVDTVILGAELSSLQQDPGWARMVDRSRQVFTGELGYSANWDAYPTAAAIPVDVISVDAYPYLGLHPWASDLELVGAWGAWLDTTSGGTPSRLVLSEVGGIAEPDMIYNPAAYDTSGAPLDEDMQRRWFTAACDAARSRDVAGFYWWKLDFHVDAALADPDHDPHDSFLGRSAERAARDCFGDWAAR